MNLSIKVSTIGPDEAEALLAGHKNYRKLSIVRAEAYARAMARGEWKLSTLIIGNDGELVDGATRLNAVIKSGKRIVFAIIYGWPLDSVVSLDNGQPRTRRQVAEAERGVKNGNKIMAMVAAIESPQRSQVVLNSEVLYLYDKYGALAEEVYSHAVHPMDSAIHLIPFARSILANESRKQEILSALDKLCAMDFHEPRMSGLRLYFSWAITRGHSHGGGAQRYEAYLRAARAIAAYLDNETIEKLYIPQVDPFDLNEPVEAK